MTQSSTLIRPLFVFGTRPEAIKMAPIIQECEKEARIFEPRICLTGQHRQMLDPFIELFGLKVNQDLDIMTPGQDLTDVTAKILVGMRTVLKEERPNLVVVQGDTSTTFAAALAAFYQQIPVVHVEAGLRTGNLRAPFPEELNRTLTSRMAWLHFAPTLQSRQNLLDENIPDSEIFVTGNTVIDALFYTLNRVKNRTEWGTTFGTAQDAIVGTKPLILITGHRRENFGEGFQNICHAVSELAKGHPDWNFVYPVHLNPNVQGPVKQILGNHPNIHLIAPLDYEPFVYLMNRSTLILTDSGGVQEEAPSIGKPVLVMRETTERPEAVEAGTVILVGTQPARIMENVTTLMTDPVKYQRMARSHNPYGDGQSAKKIIKILKNRLAVTSQNEGVPLNYETGRV